MIDSATPLSPEQRLADLEQLVKTLAAARAANKEPGRLRRNLPTLVLGAVGALFLGAVGTSVAWGSRNSAGTMSSVNGPYVANQVVASSLFNNRFGDIESELTLSLDRNGRGGMLFQLRGIDGTLAAPAFSWTSETGSGLFRNGAGDVRMSILGGLREQWTSTGVAITGTASVSGASTLTGNVGIGAAPTYPLDVQTQVGATHARFVNSTSTSIPVFVYTETSNSDIGFNLRHDGTNIKYDKTNTGALWQFETTGPALVAYTAPSGTAGNNATVTERFRINPSGVTIGAGTAISASPRGTVSWTPGSVAGGSCTTNTITVTGAAAGADTSCNQAAGTVGLLYFSCYVSALNTCNIQWCNPTGAGASTPPSGTYSCRAWNP